MEEREIDYHLYFGDLHSNRKRLFQNALINAKRGKVLYIMCNELEELPQLSQELNSTNRHYMKMISFLYASSLESLIESLATLPDWQSIPSTIILDDLSAYCNKNSLQTASGVVALLIDSVKSCRESLLEPCALYVSLTKGAAGEDYYNVMRELYFTIDEPDQID